MVQDKKFKCSTQRISVLREHLLNTVPSICVQRSVLTTKAYKEHEMDQIVLKRAYMLKEILENMTIYIEPNSLIVGNQASSNRAAPIFPEYAMDWIIRELDEFELRNGDRFSISEDSKNTLREIYPYWKGRTLQDKGYATYPENARLIYDLGIIRNEGNITSGDAHIAVDYGAVLKGGLESFRKRTQDKLDSLDLSNYEDIKKSFFYRAIIITIDSIAAFALRYAALADALAETADFQRKTELLEISRICKRVPMRPAETFYEAIQSVWFIHLILQIESNGHSLSFGRFDQYCLPFYEKSTKDGMTDAIAIELLENLWLKTFTINKIRSKGHSRFAAGSPMYQNITIGGQTTDKKSAVNALTRLVLKTVANTHLPQPNLTVRYFSDMPQSFMDECIEVIKEGFGMPAFNNDQIIIPAMIKQGVSEKDAYNYSAIGCVEVGVPGKWGYRCTGMSYLNFPKTLMTALNNGIDLNTGKQICDPVNHFVHMRTFDEVLDAWDKTARQLIKIGVTLDNCADLVIEQEVPDILCSTLVDDCIERGRHLKEGGAVYDITGQLQVGIANLGDSLAAIKRTVYDEKLLTAEELWNALINNYEVDSGEHIRKLLLSMPKYGNDDDDVDALVVKGYDTYIDEIKKYRNTRFNRGVIGGHYCPGTSSVAANVAQGASTPATPDGRRYGEPLAEGCSPQHGCDTNGPTSVFKSVSKLKTVDIMGGVLLNQKVSPNLLSQKEDCQKLSILIRAFFDQLSGFHVQYNVVSKETLLDAQKHPEKHKDLIVRVAGYSTFFNLLSTASQNDIISRTEYDII